MAILPDPDRRRFLGAAALTLGAAGLDFPAPGRAMQGIAMASPGFAPLKQIEAGLLDVTYAEAGPPDGPPVLLLHGWPYDIQAFAEVAPVLAAAGHRVIVPFLRGYG